MKRPQRNRRIVMSLLVALSCVCGLKPRRGVSVMRALPLRGGAGERPIAPSRKKGRQILDGGTGAASFQDQLIAMVDRFVSLARRIYASVLGESSPSSPPPSSSTQIETKPAQPVKESPEIKSVKPTRRGHMTPASRKAARISRELIEFRKDPPEGCKLTLGKNPNVWIVTLTGAPETIFAGEKYKLRIAFPADYPTSPPSVYFLKPPPRHPHVYTNGDICLNLLGKDWRPNLTIAQLALSILSMLSSAKQKGVPQDNALHASAQPGKPQDGWMYHDDSS